MHNRFKFYELSFKLTSLVMVKLGGYVRKVFHRCFY
jgi:hypothetical protein